jgi:fatty acid desaturase
MRVPQAGTVTTQSLLEVSHPIAAGAEWPAGKRHLDFYTLSVAIVVHGSLLALTAFFGDLPLWLAAPLGSLLLAWYGSLQHETIHGHPTSSRRVNAMLGGLPLSLWIPYGIYRETHLRHHRHGGRYLTEVERDPESFYLQPGALSNAGVIRRAIHAANCTLAGRIILGPAVAITKLWVSEARKLWSADRRRLLIWSRHVLGVAIVLFWIVGVCHVSLIVYVALVVYPSVSLTQLRSFAEHRAHVSSRLRTRVVEANPVWALIFLNNNLHIAHHAHPKLPWHQLPRAWRRMRGAVSDPSLVIRGGYREVIRNHLFRPLIAAEHPGPNAGSE